MADSNHTTIAPSTRRAVVAGIAVAPVVALPAAAVALEPDPVLVAIEAYSRAAAAVEHLREANEPLHQQWEAIASDYPVGLDLGHFSGRHLYTHGAIEKHFATLRSIYRVPEADALHIEALTQSACKRLDDLLARRVAEEDRIGVTAARRMENDALEERDRTEYAVLAAKPTTLAGAAALVAFVRRIMEEDNLDPVGDEVQVALSNVEAFLAQANAS